MIGGRFATPDKQMETVSIHINIEDTSINYLVDQASLKRISQGEMLKNRNFGNPLSGNWVCWSIKNTCKLERTNEDAYFGGWSAKISNRYERKHHCYHKLTVFRWKRMICKLFYEISSPLTTRSITKVGKPSPRC